MEENKTELFKRILNLYWLRPETALWRTVDIMTMRNFKFESPSLDVGSGDGIFSFLRAGGDLEPTYDMFSSVNNLDKFFDKVDVYDSFDKNIQKPVVIKKPEYKIDVAFDHKENLLKKAELLNLYNDFVCGDANKDFPFEDESFKTIFSNIIYWLDNPEHAFSELKRILKKDGKIAVMLPNTTFAEYSFYNSLYVKTKNPEWAFLDMIDRGRLAANIKLVKSAEEWEAIFAKVGLKVVEHKRHLHKTLIQAWDIGLRPLFPVLKKMTDKLSTEDRLDIKKDMVEICCSLLEPLCKTEFITDKEYEPAFHYYVLTK